MAKRCGWCPDHRNADMTGYTVCSQTNHVWGKRHVCSVDADMHRLLLKKEKDDRAERERMEAASALFVEPRVKL